MNLPEKTVFFDGVCNLCNSSVDFMIRNDKQKVLRYASLQSEWGVQILKENGLSETDYDSFIFVERGVAYLKSSGALRVAMSLGGWFKLFGFFFVFPAFLRDVFYSYVAKNRYKWFGKKESCRLPTPEERALFL